MTSPGGRARENGGDGWRCAGGEPFQTLPRLRKRISFPLGSFATTVKKIWPCFAIWFVVLTVPGGAAAPAILITNLPAYGSNSPLAGVALNASPATNAVAVYIYVPGYGWVTKPTCAQSLTTIQPDGSWTANVTTGGASDTTATRYAALLVGTNYNQPCVDPLPDLPTNAYAQAVAKTVITRASPGVRFLSFAGYDWWVKNYASPVELRFQF